MTPKDFDEFQRRLTAAWALYGKSITEDVLEIFWQALQAYPLADVKQALNRHAVDPDVGQYPPKPADLIRQLDGDTESQAMQAWTKVWRALGQVGTYQSVVFDDPLIHAVVAEMGGWMAFGQCTEDEQPFRAQEFVKRYRAYQAARALPPYPPTLIGRTEHTNVVAGFTEAIPAPLLIGDPAQAQQVMAQGTQGAGQVHRIRADQLAAALPQRPAGTDIDSGGPYENA